MKFGGGIAKSSFQPDSEEGRLDRASGATGADEEGGGGFAVAEAALDDRIGVGGAGEEGEEASLSQDEDGMALLLRFLRNNKSNTQLLLKSTLGITATFSSTSWPTQSCSRWTPAASAETEAAAAVGPARAAAVASL